MQEEYVDKRVLERRGFVRENGLVKRLTLIERYYFKGWLRFGDKRYDAKIRLDAANRLASDFFFSRFPNNQAIEFEKERVDGGRNKIEPERVLEARDRFFKAIREIPSEFWAVVRDVVLYEERPKFVSTKKQNEYSLYAHKVDLCRGLDRLAGYYGVSPVKPMIRGQAFAEQVFVDKPRKYEIKK